MNLLIKLLVNGIIVVPGLLWAGTSFPFALATGLFLTLFSYLLGDRYILPRTNNTFASTADLLLNFSLLWVACVVFFQPFRLTALFLTSFVLAVAEYWFHGYLWRQSADHSRNPG